jgi:7,8-dihydropterin-6-yl-methyl-4-(beta-D-ribofuranosyl)aminobenzene 5'-phosphate synthase
MTPLYFILVLLVVGALFFAGKIVQLNKGRQQTEKEISGTQVHQIPSPGAVNQLTILPLVDFHTADPSLKTEPGVSYLIKADDVTILMDCGFNKEKVHPSPLLHNMEKLGISMSDLDMIFFSHLHLDHVGGMAEQKAQTFSLSRGPVSLPDIPIYSPVPVTGSRWNPSENARVISDPEELTPGIFSIGTIPRYLFLMGRTLENALAVHVKGKGIVLIVGCGHQTIERIIDRAKALFDEPIHGIIGGLHYPVNGGRIMLGPVNIQRIVGSDTPPWQGIREADVENAIAAIKKVSPDIVALSPHDTSDWALDRFRQAFGAAYVDVKVGQKIVI